MRQDMDVAARTQPSVLIVGNDRHPEFSAVRSYLRDAASLHYFDSTSPRRGQVNVIAAFQARPGELAQEMIEQAHRSNPMATILAILGSWCEGEQRSGRPWHGVERVYWYDAVARLTKLIQGKHVPIGYRTYTAAEQVERSLQGISFAPRNEVAAIMSASRLAFEVWRDVLSYLGYNSRWFRSTDEIESYYDLILWDGNDLGDPNLLQQIQSTRARFPHAMLLAVLNFPRRDEVDTLQAAGVLVLGKPLLFADLAAALEKTAATPRSAVA